MVVIDEAQAYRNPDTQRAGVLRRLLEGTPPKDLVLLTATPVNNSLWDLYYLLGYFIRNDAAFADAGHPLAAGPLRRGDGPRPRRPLTGQALRHPRCGRRAPHPPLREAVLPATTTSWSTATRSRSRFPKPRGARGSPTTSRRCCRASSTGSPTPWTAARTSATTRHRGSPSAGPEPRPLRALAVPAHWPRVRGLRDLQLAGLLRSGLLKRFESSPYAFALTCRRMADSHDAFLDLLDTRAGGHRDRPWPSGCAPTPTSSTRSDRRCTGETLDGASRLRRGGAAGRRGGRPGPASRFAAEAGEVDRHNDDPKLRRAGRGAREIAAEAREEGIGSETRRRQRER